MKSGDRFLHFVIETFLGRGNFGDVFEAYNMLDGRHCALKIVQKGVGEEEEAKYQAEIFGAKLQKALADPMQRVATVFDFGIEESSGTFFIEMEFIKGEDLAMLIRRQEELKPTELARMGVELCGLLAWLSQTEVSIDGHTLKSIVHGDLKPRNVRIEAGTNKIKVLDFGIARALKETKVTIGFNSPAYTSPERLESGKADANSDLWAVGVMLYELACGQLPFQEDNREQLERRIRSQSPPVPLPPNYPPQLRRLIIRMLRRNPAERFATPADACKAFEDYLNGIPTPDNSDETVRVATGGDSDPTVRASSPTIVSRKNPMSYADRDPRNQLAIYGSISIVVIIAVWIGFAGYGAYAKASDLASELDREQVKNSDDAWKRYTELRDDTWFASSLWPARRALKRQLVNAGNEVIQKYRVSETNTIFERHWRAANTALTRAMELDPSDGDVKASLRLTEGHLARIQCSSSAARKDSSIKQEYANTAVQKFHEAAALRAKWPDPYLGLARLYAEEYTDMEKAADALETAQRLGYQTGKKEKTQLAYAIRRIIDKHWDESRKLREMPDQEKQLLNKAHDHCRNASHLYEELGVYQNSVDNYRLLLTRCADIDKRLEEMSQPSQQAPPATP